LSTVEYSVCQEVDQMHSVLRTHKMHSVYMHTMCLCKWCRQWTISRPLGSSHLPLVYQIQ